MAFLQSWMGEYFLWIVSLAVIAVVLTIYIFSRRRNFDSGPKKGVARNPGKVRRENPPDEDNRYFK